MPRIPFKNQILCITSPCNPITRYVSLYDLVLNNAYNSLLFVTTWTFILPVVDLLILYAMASTIYLAIINKKLKLSNALIIIAGILIIISKTPCLINYSDYSCRYYFYFIKFTPPTLAASYLNLTALAAGMAVAGYGLYRLIKYR